jgi:hypothetical protein
VQCYAVVIKHNELFFFTTNILSIRFALYYCTTLKNTFMKRNLLFAIVAIVTVSLASCGKNKTGDVTFWQQTGSGYGVTVVSVDGVTSNITSEYGSAPSCGTSGCAVFNGLDAGSYNYTASDGSATWSGSVTITEGCKTVQLY